MKVHVGEGEEKNINLQKGAHIHLMGICGTAMASLAGLFKGLGYRVTGSDQNVYPPMSTQLADLGIDIWEGYHARHLDSKPDLVIVGNVISRQYEEAQALLASTIPYTSLPKALGEFVIDHRHSIVVSGTHGKTTTTSMMAWVAESCGKSPGYLIGGIPKNFKQSFEFPQGDFFVIEGDEYDTAFFDKVPKFIHYRPRSVILTSVEFDHADIYRDLEDVKRAFRQLIELVPENGRLVYYGEDENLASLLTSCRYGNKVSYGLNRGDYRAVDVEVSESGTSFGVNLRDVSLGRVTLKVFGQYNILNALAAIALSLELGWPKETVFSALAHFEGVKRRQEVIGQPNGITVIEDFAHHPTAVRLTIQSLSERFGAERLFAVFEPRSATSRRKIFQKDYVRALSGSHNVILAPAFDQSKISSEDRLDQQELLQDIKATGTWVYQARSIDDIIDSLKTRARRGDVIVLMSNGGFGGIYQKLLDQLNATRG